MADTFRDMCAELLAQAEPPKLTDEELLAMRSWSSHGHTFDSDLVDFARAVLAKWGRPTPQPESIEDRIAKADAAIEASMERIRKIAATPTAELVARPKAIRNDYGVQHSSPLSTPLPEPPSPISAHDLAIQWNQQADQLEQWDSLDLYEQLAWAQVRAIAADRARWSNSQEIPTPNQEN